MKKRIVSVLVILSYILSLTNAYTVNAAYVSDNYLGSIENAKTVYLDKTFKVDAVEYKTDYGEYYTGSSYYKIDVGSSNLSIIDIQTDIDTSTLDYSESDYYFEIYYLSGGKLLEADYIDRSKGGRFYALDKNKVYYLRCRVVEDVNVTLYNKTKEGILLKKNNKGTITSGFEQLYKYKATSKNNETVIDLSYSGEGATLNDYIIGLDKKGNVYVNTKSYEWITGRLKNYYFTFTPNIDHYIFLEVENYTVPTDYKLTILSGPEQKVVNKAKFKKKYSGNTFGTPDSYHYRIKANHSAKLKVEIKGKNVVAVFNGRKVIKCKKKVTKTIWVDAISESFTGNPKDIYVKVYQKGHEFKYNTKGQGYTIKITKLKEKKW